MFEKPEIKKESMMKIIAALVVASIVFLTLSILTDPNDSRKQISDNDGATETLCSILSEIKGVGEVSAMLQYDDKDNVTGVIVTAVGADDLVVKNDIVKGVAALFDIPASSVMVFEKDQEEKAE